jgi:NAD(P)-dependent dehydrogenase (short-subunit alcohol dehydrogenase family)
MTIFNLENKKIYLIGGSGLIGKEVANLLGFLGAEVYNLDINRTQNNNKNIKFLKLPINKETLIEKKLKFYFKKYGAPDCMVNCSYPATKSWKNSDFKSVKKKTINENVNLHLNSYIWIARIFAEEMRKKKIKGSIIQFSSHYGVIGQNSELYKGTKFRENMIYSAIKGGIISNVKQMCSHYGKYGIRINAISPGGIRGHMKGKSKSQPASFIHKYCLRTPLKRLADAKEISPAVAFLASDLSSYITGINLMIDGGWTAT